MKNSSLIRFLASFDSLKHIHVLFLNYFIEFILLKVLLYPSMFKEITISILIDFLTKCHLFFQTPYLHKQLLSQKTSFLLLIDFNPHYLNFGWQIWQIFASSFLIIASIIMDLLVLLTTLRGFHLLIILVGVIIRLLVVESRLVCFLRLITKEFLQGVCLRFLISVTFFI